MSAMSVEVPYPVFTDKNGEPLENGYVWVGTANLNPQTNPVQVYFDRDLTQPAAQPLRTIAGYVSNAGTPSQIYINGNNYSIMVQDKNGTMVYNFANGTGIEPIPNDACGLSYTPDFPLSVTRPTCEKLEELVSVKDFGAVGDGVTDDTLAIQNAILSGKSLYFPQPDVFYNISSDITIANSFEAGSYRIFGGAGNVTINPGTCEYVIPQWWGASPSASANDNTVAINKSVNCYPKVGTDTNFLYWRLPSGNYNIDNEIVFPTGRILYSKILFEGRLNQTNQNANGVVFNNVFRSDIINVRVVTTWDSWANSRAGVSFNTCATNNVSIAEVRNFEKGLYLNKDNVGPTGYSNFEFGFIRENKYGVYGTPDASAANYINANTFSGGEFSNQFKSTTSGSAGVYIKGPSYGNKFNGQTFEAMNYGYAFDQQFGFNINGLYCEQLDFVADLTNCSNGFWAQSYQELTRQNFITNANTRRIVFANAGEAATEAPILWVDQTGLRFYQFTGSGAKDSSVQLRGDFYNGGSGLSFINHHNISIRLNKSYSGTNAPPTSGTYNIGAIVWNTSSITPGQPIGYMCKTLGTAGTLSGVTANTTAGSRTVTVNDSTNLLIGQYINIVGVPGTLQIDRVLSATIIFLVANVSATVSGAAVSYFAPTWQALPNF